MPFSDLENDQSRLIHILTDNFNILADQVQLLSDRKTVLEHKLRFAHEQYQQLADKYATGDPAISSTLAKLHLPPDLQTSVYDRAGFVPLPQKNQQTSKQHTAVAIRDGRKAAHLLSGLTGGTNASTVSARSDTGTSSNVRLSARRTSLSTVLEQDFTVQGKKGSLLCPFSSSMTPVMLPTMNPSPSHGSATLNSDGPLTPLDMKDFTPHQSADPICAALYAETMSSPPPSASGSAAKCPIRYLDQHSPEEVARYFETHKHEIPRSHEICVKRYQRNEDDIRKLDAKYGNLVSMIQGLGQKHQPMLPLDEEEQAEELERTSAERVENWALDVNGDSLDSEGNRALDEDDRSGRFERPLKEIRVGESPSRPWGISVPILDPPEGLRPESPPPAPVSAEHTPRPAGKFPLGHDQSQEKPLPPTTQEKPAGKCPFPHARNAAPEVAVPMPEPNPATYSQPAFLQLPQSPQIIQGSVAPQMIFTGPVFIGYPMEQAIAFMQQYKSNA